MFKSVLLLYVLVFFGENDAARILSYYPTPSISHQVVYRPLTLELARRGHEVVVITTDPIFPNGGGPKNLKEINLHDESYGLWKEMLEKLKNRADRSMFDEINKYLLALVELQLTSSEVKTLLNDKTVKFDLIIVEVFVEVVLGLSHVFKAPVIQFSSLAVTSAVLNNYGTPTHPLLFPSPFHDKLYNLTAQEKITEAFKDYMVATLTSNTELFDAAAKRVFGPDVPSIEVLRQNLDMLFLGVHAIWDFNRPVPPNVIYLGGLHDKEPKKLPEDLQKYLDSSKNGVIYVSFGTNVDPGMFSPEKIQALVNAFSKLPYDVLWKWNQDELPGRTENIKISKWLPQTDILRHPKTKLFITQGGLQSTDETINAGVPAIGIPIMSDQKFNVEQYVHFGIGEKVNLETITEEELTNAINKVVGNDSYRKNVEKLRSIMNDQPIKPLEKAVWWTEYVIRHKGAKHLRSPSAYLSAAEYYELEIITYMFLGIASGLVIAISVVYFVCRCVFCRRKAKDNKKEKDNKKK